MSQAKLCNLSRLISLAANNLLDTDFRVRRAAILLIGNLYVQDSEIGVDMAEDLIGKFLGDSDPRVRKVGFQPF